VIIYAANIATCLVLKTKKYAMTSYGFVQPDLIKSDYSPDTSVGDSVVALETRIISLEGIVLQLVNLINVLQSPAVEPG
jgi:hypothetical protein